MKYFFDIAYAIELIALAAGVKLILSACKQSNCWSTFAKFVGMIITLLAAIMLVCTAMCGYTQWKEGRFDLPPMHASMDKVKPVEAQVSSPMMEVKKP